MCTCISGTLKNTFSKWLQLCPRVRLRRGSMTTETSCSILKHDLCILYRRAIHAFVITSAFVCENAGTVVGITFACRTLSTLRRRPYAQKVANTGSTRSQKHSSTRSFIPQAHDARVRRDRRWKVALKCLEPCEFKKRTKGHRIQGLSRRWVATSHESSN